MTNKEDEGDAYESRLAALLAVHLVSQVLDEAYVIVNAATESGQPWRYLEMLKGLRSGKLGNIEEEKLSCVSKGDAIEEINSKINEATPDIVATSTPQKMTDEIGKLMNNTNFIGQGDEELMSDMRQAELNSPTSMFINHLFDMSEVEGLVICDDTEVIKSNQEPNDLLTEAMTKIMESYVNTALGIAFGQDIDCADSTTPPVRERSPSTEYSFLTDALNTEVGAIIGDIAFCVDKEIIERDKSITESSVIITEVTEHTNKEVEREHNENDVSRYENAFLTLNRDYDQCSEENSEPILEDTKGMLMQEIELKVTQAPDSELVINEIEQSKEQELRATSAVSATASSRKSSLVQRCRTHGARLLACLRGWWRRKTPGKRKEIRVPGSVRGMCPLSPDARRRAASLLDQSHLGSSPYPSRHVVWKFNTVSEALVNSSRWKNYTFDVNPGECGEYL